MDPGSHAVGIGKYGQGDNAGDNPGRRSAAVGAVVGVVAQPGVGEVAVMALGAEVSRVHRGVPVVAGCSSLRRGHVVNVGGIAGVIVADRESRRVAEGIPLGAVGREGIRYGPTSRGTVGWERAAAPVRGCRGGKASRTRGLEAQQAVGRYPGACQPST